MAQRRQVTTVVSTGAVLAALPWVASAAGFAVLEQSTERMGTAYAGTGTDGDNIGAIWYNPATLTRFDNSLEVGSHLVDPRFEYDLLSTPTEVPGSAGLLLNSDTSADGGITSFIPNFAYGASVNDRWYAGITVNVPFGLSTEYTDDWVGRYQALDSTITSANINPMLAYRINSEWAVGAGVSFNYTDVSLSRAVDFAAVCAQLAGGLCPNGALPGTGGFDGEVETAGSDISFGYNMGVLWSPQISTQISLSYRSEIEHKLEGDGDFTEPSPLGGFAALGPTLGGSLATAFSDSDIEADLTLPDTASLSVQHFITPETTVLADATWTGWANLREIRINFDNPLTPTAVEPLQWENTWRYALGIEHRPNDDWTWRAGLAFDESPVPNARLRTPRLPDDDRRWLTLGASRHFSSNFSMDIGYAHIFIDDTPIQWTRDNGDVIRGEYDSAANNISLGFNFRF